MTMWWSIRPGGWPKRLACTPLGWPCGIALSWYGRGLAVGVRIDRDFQKWAIDILPLTVHGWWGRDRWGVAE